MFLYSRALTLRGSPRNSIPWVARITEHVNANSTLDVAAWTADFGEPLGTVVWNCLLEDQAQLAEAAAALATQDAYLDLIDEAADMIVAPAEDSLASLVHGSPSEVPAVGWIANVTQATAVVDRISDTLTWSVDIAEHIEGIADGMPVSVWSNIYGQMGRLAFISVAPDMGSFQKSQDATFADQGYYDRLAKSAGLWMDGSGHVARYTRLF